MGCCSGMNKVINLNKDVSILPGKVGINLDYENNKNPISDFQIISKSDEEIVKKEKSSNKCTKNNKNYIVEKKKDKNTEQNISPNTNIENEDNKSKVNKNKVIKKGSQRVQRAMKELKMLSMKDIDNNKNFFNKSNSYEKKKKIN